MDRGIPVGKTAAALQPRPGRDQVRLTPYSAKAAPKTALWEVVDPYMRFWLRFVNRKVDLIERGRGSLLVEDFRWRAQVPGASEKTLLVGVSSRGFEPGAGLDVRLSPEDLIDAWRG